MQSRHHEAIFHWSLSCKQGPWPWPRKPAASQSLRHPSPAASRCPSQDNVPYGHEGPTTGDGNSVIGLSEYVRSRGDTRVDVVLDCILSQFNDVIILLREGSASCCDRGLRSVYQERSCASVAAIVR